MHSTAVVAKWLERIFEHEGGFTRDRNDPGNWTGGKVGLGVLKGTKYGIAANTYGHLDIENLTPDDAAGIYVKDYLLPLRADRYGPALAYQMFDTAINSGVGRAALLLQEALGVAQDGVIGPVTLTAVEQLGDFRAAIGQLSARLDFMTDLDVWSQFGRGWGRRIALNMRYIMEDAA